METKDRQRLLVITTAVIAGLWMADYAVFEPLKNSWYARQQHIKDLKELVGKDKILISERARFEAHWEHMRSESLPANRSQAEGIFLQAKDRWVQASGITVDSISP